MIAFDSLRVSLDDRSLRIVCHFIRFVDKKVWPLSQHPKSHIQNAFNKRRVRMKTLKHNFFFFFFYTDGGAEASLSAQSFWPSVNFILLEMG